MEPNFDESTMAPVMKVDRQRRYSLSGYDDATKVVLVRNAASDSLSSWEDSEMDLD